MDEGHTALTKEYAAGRQNRSRHHYVNLARHPARSLHDSRPQTVGLKFKWFRSRAEAKVVIEARRLHFNAIRPHSSLNDLTPLEFEQQHL